MYSGVSSLTWCGRIRSLERNIWGRLLRVSRSESSHAEETYSGKNPNALEGVWDLSVCDMGTHSN